MKFEDKGVIPHNYRYKFLDYVDESVPDVYETLKSFLPKYKELFGALDLRQTMNVFDCIIANKTQNENDILININENFRYNKSNAPQLNEITALKNFSEFRRNYFEFIQRFGLETEWLKRDLFTFLNTLTKFPQYNYKLSFATGCGWNPYCGEPILFQFKSWKVIEESKNFEKDATTAFNNYLRDYVKETAQKATIQGYKKIRRPKNYERLRWLVRWTVQRKKMREIADEFCVEERTIWDAFETFKKYDLPIRLKNKTEGI